MTIDEAIQEVDNLINDFDVKMSKVSEMAALDAKAIIILRIQNEGIGKTYSTKKIPAYLLLLDENKLDTQKTIDFVKSKANAEEKEDRYTNWAEVREAHGNQSAFVDLTFTGRMLNNIGIIRTEVKDRVYHTYVGGFTEEVRQKIAWNVDRYGDFFQPTAEEEEILKLSTQENIDKLFTNLNLI